MSDLYSKRGALGFNSPQGVLLAPQEHQEFAREWVSQNPWIAFPSLLAAIPAYQGAKAMGLRPHATPASFDQLAGGYSGMWEGLAQWLQKQKSTQR